MLAKRWVLKNVLGRLAGVRVGQACGWARNLIKAWGGAGEARNEAESLLEYRDFLDGWRQEVVGSRRGRLG